MKKLIYKNPIMSAVILNIVSFIIFMFSISQRTYGVLTLIIIVGIANNQIIINGENIDRQKKFIIYISFILMIIIYIPYAMYKIYNK